MENGRIVVLDRCFRAAAKGLQRLTKCSPHRSKSSDLVRTGRERPLLVQRLVRGGSTPCVPPPSFLPFSALLASPTRPFPLARSPTPKWRTPSRPSPSF